MYSSVLFVDDDPAILSSFKRSLSTEFNVFVSDSPEQCLRMVEEQGPFSVVVSDMRMPGMHGLELLRRVREINRDIVRILLTGHADRQAAIEAVNRCEVFRFLTKPCDQPTLIAALREGIETYRRAVAEKGAVGSTLSGVVNLLAQILSVAAPEAQRKANRLKRYCRHLAQGNSQEERWTVESAALLSQVGHLAAPISRRAELAAGQEHPAVGSNASGFEQATRLLMHVPTFADIVTILSLQDKPTAQWSHAIDIAQQVSVLRCARMVRAALKLDELLGTGMRPNEALTALRADRDLDDSALIDRLASYQFDRGNMARTLLHCRDVQAGMIIAEDVYGSDGTLVACCNEPVTPVLLTELHRHERLGGLREPFAVFRAIPAEA